MRKLVITQNITLDGRIEILGDWFSPAVQHGQLDLIEELARQSATTDAEVLGRRTFEDLREYWPHQADDPTGIAAALDRVTKYVVSSTMTEPGWARSEVLAGDPVTAVRALKATGGGDIVCTGSIGVVHALVPSGLVDEYRLYVYPVVQGRGRRLFPEGVELPRLELLEARTFRSGVVLQRYRPVTG